MVGKLRSGPLVALCLLMSAATLYGLDHGRPVQSVESTLGGVTLEESISSVIKRLGRPSKTTDTPETSTPWRAGERAYVWKDGDVTFTVYEAYYQTAGMRAEHSSGVRCIQVAGTKSSSPFAATGRGLRLGDDVSAVQRIYGKVRTAPNHVHFELKNGVIVDLDLDAHKRIKTIQLLVDDE